MKQFKGTPGPWNFRHNINEGYATDMGGFIGGSGKVVCWFGDGETYYPTEGTIPDKEDICLIAAAPELLEALQQSLPIWEAMKLNVSEASVLLDCHAAINKALGVKND